MPLHQANRHRDWLSYVRARLCKYLSDSHMCVSSIDHGDAQLVVSRRANRPAPELEAIIGYFVNPVALRTQIEGSCTFRQAVQRVRETVVGAQANAEVSPLLWSMYDGLCQSRRQALRARVTASWALKPSRVKSFCTPRECARLLLPKQVLLRSERTSAVSVIACKRSVGQCKESWPHI